jgi:F-type H+-transporting ATPase subunit a
MEKLEHPLVIVDLVNAAFAPLLGLFGLHSVAGHHLIPNYLVMTMLIVFGFLVLGLVVRSQLSVDDPGRLQIILEDLVSGLAGMLDEFIGPTGRQYLPLVGAIGCFVLVGNYAGLVPGLMAPTSNINVPAGLAVMAWSYYHFHGIRVQGPIGYVGHFFGPPGVPLLMKPIFFLIELISHTARALSLTLRLFGNIFGEELVILILAMLVPFFLPLPIMALSLITGGLQAFIFVLLTIIYLQGAVVVEHHDDHSDAKTESGHGGHAHEHGHATAAA